MIKNLRLKFVLVFLILVVSVFITSSCYASPSSSLTYDSEFTLADVKNSLAFTTYDSAYKKITGHSDVVWKFIIYRTSDNSIDKIYCFASVVDSIIKLPDSATLACVNNSPDYLCFKDENGNKLIGFHYFVIDYDNSTNKFSTNQSNTTYSNFNTTGSFSNYTTFNLSTLTEYKVSAYGLNYEPSINTSFSYEIVGSKRGQVKLTINDLNPSLNMFGYVGCENKFNVGDVLDTSSIADNLRMFSTLLDKSDLYCYLYDGEKLLYYIVDENNVILDIGYITEMCEGYYLYGFPVNDGVDFVFLNDGVPYWSNDLTFKYQVNNGKLFTKNEVVSSGSYVYIETDKTVHNATYYGFVYDSSGNEISKASIIAINNLSSLHVESLNTRYSEFTTGWFSDTTSVYELYNLQLAGTNPDGSYIDFTNYSVRWYIEPYTTLLETVKVNNIDSSKRFGTVSGFDPHFGILENFELEIHQLLGKRIAAFDIVFDIYDGNDNLVLKHIVNSDDIVKDQIIYNEILPNKPDYDILDNPNYSGGNKYPNSDNIQNWEIDDFVSYLGTDNSVFNFFWAFLNNMPTWISTPLSILLIGLVIITLYKFIRG